MYRLSGELHPPSSEMNRPSGETNRHPGRDSRHKVERFPAHHYPDPALVPMPLPSRTNNDIQKYFNQAGKPLVSGLVS
jgi:hypothetical protein